VTPCCTSPPGGALLFAACAWLNADVAQAAEPWRWYADKENLDGDGRTIYGYRLYAAPTKKDREGYEVLHRPRSPGGPPEHKPDVTT
jgi:hypothetical protein